MLLGLNDGFYYPMATFIQDKEDILHIFAFKSQEQQVDREQFKIKSGSANSIAWFQAMADLWCSNNQIYGRRPNNGGDITFPSGTTSETFVKEFR